jgi:hypothetical protein
VGLFAASSELSCPIGTESCASHSQFEALHREPLGLGIPSVWTEAYGLVQTGLREHGIFSADDF